MIRGPGSPGEFPTDAAFVDPGRGRGPEDRSGAGQLRPTSTSRAIVLGNLALARPQQHDLDGAVTAAHEAIDVLEPTWEGGGLSIVFSAARQMKPWAHTPAVSDVRERLLSLIAAH